MKPDKMWPVVVAEDDPDERELLLRAWSRADVSHQLLIVEDGEALLELLRSRKGPVAFVLMDVKMPRKDGHEALGEMKQDDHLRGIPVIMLSASKREDDVRRAYDLGAVSYFVKADSIDGMTSLVRLLDSYWLERAEIPGAPGLLIQ
jgi:CheY-like chemotaxis protein